MSGLDFVLVTGIALASYRVGVCTRAIRECDEIMGQLVELKRKQAAACACHSEPGDQQ